MLNRWRNGIALPTLLTAAAMFVSVPATAEDIALPEPNLGMVPSTPAGEALARMFADGRYADAVAVAQQVLDDARTGDTPAPLTPLLNLAAARLRAGDMMAAIEAYERALECLRASGNSRDPRRVQPLLGLGSAAFRAEDYERAVDAFARAAFISRVRGGPASRAQLRAYDALVASRVALGRFDAAARRQRMRLSVIARAAGRDSPDYAGALQRAGDWFRSIGWYPEARRLYREQRRRLREREGRDDTALVPVLRGIAATFAGGNESGFEGLQSLEQALAIQRASPDTPPTAIAETYLALGDLYLAYDADQEADRHYRRAHAILEEAGATAALERLQQPRPVFWPRAPANAVSTAGTATEAVRVSLTVTDDGRVFDAAIADAPGVGSGPRTRALEAVRNARFRPRITARGMLRTEDVTYRYELAR